VSPLALHNIHVSGELLSVKNRQVYQDADLNFWAFGFVS